jgi:hypothetical protein
MQNQAKNPGPRARRLITHYCACIVLLSLGGCQVLGLAAYKLHGPAKVPAKYLPERKPMLVLVENYRHQSSVNAHADVLAQFVMKDLEQHKVAPLVPLERLHALRDAQRDEFGRMSIAAIGRETGASQVLYVQLHRSDVTPLAGGDTLDGKSEASVKVVDVATGETLWPAGVAAEAGYPVSAATKLGAANAGVSNVADVRQRLYYELGNQIGRLFYKWQPEYDEA